MTVTQEPTAGATGGVVGLVRRINGAAGLIPYDLVAFAARLFPAIVFWQSGQTKVDGVIQIFVFPEAWLTHGLWAVALLIVAARGPGRLSADYVLRLDRGRSG